MSTIVDCPSCTRKVRLPDDLLGMQVRCPTCGGTFEAAANGAAPTRTEAPPPEQPPTESVPPTPPVPQLEIPPMPQLQIKLTLEENVPPQPATEPPPERDSRLPRPGVHSCPSCGEEVGRDAVRCAYCNVRFDEPDDRDLDGGPRGGPRYGYDPPQRRDVEPHRGGLVLTLGILSVVAAATIMTVFLSFLCFAGLPLGIAAWVMGHRDLRKMREGVMDVRGRGNTQAGWICGIIGVILNGIGALGCGGLIGMFIYEEAQPRPWNTGPGGGNPAPKFQQGSPLRLHEYVPRLAR